MSVTEEKRADITSQIMAVSSSFSDFIHTEFADFSSHFDEKLEEGVYELLNVEKPKVMVYGIYNSGKSTLINALCREQVAETANRPTTDQITEYDRGDYCLVDSPGVDAPIQHEMVTEDHINKCHVILFVISSKGMFEDRTNYQKLVNLIQKNIPFIIVLNDRGIGIDGKDLTREQKKRVLFEHDQELKVIQYKIIDNLIRESNDKSITDKYEVIIVNAKKAWMGIEKQKTQLYENSHLQDLDKRIHQKLTSESDIGAIYQSPIANLKDCLNEVEKMITQTMSGNSSDDFKVRLETLAKKKDNLLENLKVLIQQTVQNYLDELTNSYVNGDADVFETIANSIYMDVDDRYADMINDLHVFVERNFQELNLFMDDMSNLSYDPSGKVGSKLTTEAEKKSFEVEKLPEDRKGSWDFLKTRKKREKERLERLEREAEIRNQQAQYEVQEHIRRKQEARQLASGDLYELTRELQEVVRHGLIEKYDDITSQIQQIDCMNQQVREDGERQMMQVRGLRQELLTIENSMA